MSQKDQVLDFLKKNGEITSMAAFKKLNITRLSAVIFQLREEGYAIHLEMKRGKGSYYGVYTLDND